MDAAQEKEKKPVFTESAAKEWAVTKPTSDEEIHDQTAQAVAVHSTAAGHPTSTEAVKGGKVLTITPEMRNIGIEPTGSDIPVNVVKMVTEDLIGAPEGTHRAGYGKSGHGLYNIIERIKGKMKFKNQKLQKAA